MKSKWTAGVSIPVALMLGLCGCSASTGDAPAASAGAGSSEKGTLVVGTAPTLRPLEYVDDKNEVTGLIIDLINAVAEKLSLKVSYEQLSFDGLIPAVQSNRIDMVTSMGDLPDRRATLTFIDYLQSGAALVVPDGNPKNVGGPDDLCGLQVAFAKGSAQQVVTEDADAKCKAAGKPAVTMAAYPSGSEAILALRSGQSDASWTDVVNANYVMDQTPNTFEIAYVNPGMGYGIGFPKEDVELREKFFDALQSLRDDGTYDKLTEKYGLSGVKIDKFTINRGEGLDVPTATPAA